MSMKSKLSTTKGPLKPKAVHAAEDLSPRGLRSRTRIKDAALELLNKQGFSTLRVQDVTQHAGVANGLFYRYFKDLREVTHILCRELFDEINANSRTLPFDLHPYDWIYENHITTIRYFSTNPGLLACMFELPSEFSEFGDIWKSSAHDWNLQVAKFLEVVCSYSGKHARNMAFVLGAMTEGVIYQTLLRHTEDLVCIAQTPEDISEIVAVMWYRAIFFEAPPKEKMRLKDTGLLTTRKSAKPMAIVKG